MTYDNLKQRGKGGTVLLMLLIQLFVESCEYKFNSRDVLATLISGSGGPRREGHLIYTLKAFVKFFVNKNAIKHNLRDIDAQQLEIQGGGGSWGFGQIIFGGVFGVVRKSRGSSFCVLLHFNVNFFRTLPLPHDPPSCVHLCESGTTY